MSDAQPQSPISASRLPELIAMAREPSSEARRSLLRELTDHFFGSTTHTEVERDLYGTVLAALSSDMEQAVKAELSKRFAQAAEAPRSLIRKLALDEAPVAAPVLRQSPVLSEDDLMAVVREKGQFHLRAVSQRETVSQAVSDIIIDRGDDATLGALLRNDGADISRSGAEIAVDRARLNSELHAATVERSSFPPDLLNEMYFVVEAHLRQKILEKNAALDPVLLENALNAGRDQIATEDGVLPDDHAECLAYVNELKAANQLSPQMLARFLRAKSKTNFLIALSQLADIDFHTARQIIERKEIDALAVVCRAATLERALFLTYAVAILGSEDNALGKAQTYAQLYNELDREAALRTLRFWRMRRTAQAA